MNDIKILKEAFVFLIVIILSFTNISAISNIQKNSTIKNDQNDEFRHEISSSLEGAYQYLCYENFTSGILPPINGKYGNWTGKSAGEITWHNCTGDPKTLPYCAAVERGFSINQSDEWLITPYLNFSEIINSKIYLDFCFLGNYHTAHVLDNIDFNIKISINNGSDWNQVWNEDYLQNIYTNEWAEIEKIDLTQYKGNSSVLIGFQFITFDNHDVSGQYIYLDEIYVYNESDIELNCDIGGPYEWDINRQYEYIPWGVRFHAKINEPYNPYQCTFLWDFGDGNSTIIYGFSHAVHRYKYTGKYNITLTVTHNALGVFTKEKTTLVLFIGIPGAINVKLQNFSIGIKAQIKNLEDYNATDVNWQIEAEWGLFLMQGKLVGNGTIQNLEPKISQNIQSTASFFALGLVHIVITISPENMIPVTETYYAIKIGPFILHL